MFAPGQGPTERKEWICRRGQGQGEGRAQVEGLARVRGEALPSPGRGGRCGARQAAVVGVRRKGSSLWIASFTSCL